MGLVESDDGIAACGRSESGKSSSVTYQNAWFLTCLQLYDD